MENHRIDINGIESEVGFNAFFEDGVYAELARPAEKKDSLMQNLSDQNGTDVDLEANFYESKSMALPISIYGNTQEELLLRFNAFSDFLTSGVPIVLSVHFFGRKYTLRYKSVSNLIWNDTIVNFSLNVFNDNPTANTPI